MDGTPTGIESAGCKAYGDLGRSPEGGHSWQGQVLVLRSPSHHRVAGARQGTGAQGGWGRGGRDGSVPRMPAAQVLARQQCLGQTGAI